PADEHEGAQAHAPTPSPGALRIGRLAHRNVATRALLVQSHSSMPGHWSWGRIFAILPPMRSLAIEVRGLTKRFGEVQAVDEVSFAVESGTTVGLLGGNGAGKTTTIAMLLGLLVPSAGTIRVLGADMLSQRYQVLGRMNFSSPYVELPHRLTVLENL